MSCSFKCLCLQHMNNKLSCPLPLVTSFAKMREFYMIHIFKMEKYLYSSKIHDLRNFKLSVVLAYF